MMKQTNTYKLNLIEKDDVFSPDPLNENAEKTDAVLSGLQAALAGQSSATDAAVGSLNSRVAVLEAKRIVSGGYKGSVTSNSDHTPQFINLGFTPKLVFLRIGNTLKTAIVTQNLSYPSLKIVEGGFQVSNRGSNDGLDFNYGGGSYVAFG